jgi:flagellar motor switch/type III secretory pathway protein FliN
VQSALHVLKHGGCRRVELADLRAEDACKLTNRLYGSHGVQAGGLIWYWQITPGAQVRDWIVLSSHDSQLRIGLHGDAIGLDTRQVDWRQYEGATQLLAWTACHEPVIELLRAVFRTDWVPEIITHPPDAHTDTSRVRAQFAIQRGDGATVVTGVAELAVHWLEGLAQREDQSRARPHAFLSRIPARLPMVMDELDITPQDLVQIERGCILRLDNKLLLSKQPRVAIRIGCISWLADMSDLRATVTGFAANSSGELPMKDTVEVTTLPVRLSFTAGRLIVPFGNLSEVGPGYVFELDKRLDDQVITVHANETPVAVGELVSIGDMVGVRITRMLIKA